MLFISIRCVFKTFRYIFEINFFCSKILISSLSGEKLIRLKKNKLKFVWGGSKPHISQHFTKMKNVYLAPTESFENRITCSRYLIFNISVWRKFQVPIYDFYSLNSNKNLNQICRKLFFRIFSNFIFSCSFPLVFGYNFTIKYDLLKVQTLSNLLPEPPTVLKLKALVLSEIVYRLKKKTHR